MNRYEKSGGRRKIRWAMGLAGILCTVCALILPVMTLEQGGCPLPEHIHTDACYTQVTSVERKVPVCGVEYAIHTHDANCYLPDGSLWCRLPELEAHTHDAGCYAQPSHTHSEACYTVQRGELTCTQHVHSDACYAESRELICNLPESEEHTHGDGCYETRRTLVCGVESDHRHTDDCYAQASILSCGFPEESSAPTLICGKEEICPHTHQPYVSAENPGCYDGEGNLVCGKRELLRHQHTDACFQTVEEPVDTECLTCTDPDHVHTRRCYGTWVLSCTMEEHIHDESCQTGTASEPETEPETEPVLTGDDALVSALEVEAQRQELSGAPWLVRSGEAAAYRVTVKTESATDAVFTRGRVKLELVLPLTAQQGAFDLSAMSWLDTSDGYAPAVKEESRLTADGERICQVLTGYRLLASEDGAIPGEFTETVAVNVLDATPGTKVGLQVSAAMEYNTWEGVCPAHQVPERLTVESDSFTTACSVEEAQTHYRERLAEVETIESAGDSAAAEAMLNQLEEDWLSGYLMEDACRELYERVYTLLYGSAESAAEAVRGSNWMLLRDSGWFEAYSGETGGSSAAQSARAFRAVRSSQPEPAARSAAPSDTQVDSRGGTNANESDGVSVSKTIAGTELENVFDITLQVQTTQHITEITTQPDMAVVIVMDISNTMKEDFGGVSRYAAAMAAAERFLDQFARNNSQGISQVGFVAFNTDAHRIFGLQSCDSAAKANALKNTMRTQTGSIINASGYADSHSRFTNVEAGLAMAADMLSASANRYQYVVFLSDGFPTTYISSGYSGHDPYGSTGGFYDHVLNKPCTYGTSYSDRSAIRAREKAAAMKRQGITIFSVGVDIGGQTIQQYITQSERASGYSVVDRTGTSYEIGDAGSAQAYKNWLKNRIGSGYYYDSTDASGLTNAFQTIFQAIRQEVEEASRADWVASDPIPGQIEFLGFYNQSEELTIDALQGDARTDGENTAAFSGDDKAIRWDLKASGYQEIPDGTLTRYIYRLRYRVRLENEGQAFGEGTIYQTNGATTLRYRILQRVDESSTLSEPKTLAFPIPAVHGYLAELTFQKTDTREQPLAGAEFTLRHDTGNCKICRGDGTSVAVADQTGVSDADGTVSFRRVPSGHQYLLTETQAPPGYVATQTVWQVVVAYDGLTVTGRDVNEDPVVWDGTIQNALYYVLPETGGTGTAVLAAGGLALMTGAAVLLTLRARRRKEAGRE
ncbi:MAG: SpaA isopeptide-forming pilin-related protein [Candidatus Faecousia sp.]|nr:SpaA isopeptide-forming pilin-related protein [Candidatus Faecousia sp.]